MQGARHWLRALQPPRPRILRRRASAICRRHPTEVHTFLPTRESGEEQEAAGAGGQDRRGEELHHKLAGVGVGDSKGAPFTVPIPGTTKLTNLTSNVGAVAVELRPDEMRALEEAIPVDEVAGSRYGNVTREEQAAFLEEARRLARSSTI